MNQYFYEDQVFTVDKKGNVKFGLVVENEVSYLSFGKNFLEKFPFSQKKKAKKKDGEKIV
jgi:hypothetical protein